MTTTAFKIFLSWCQAVCVIATVALTLYCFIEYSKNKDTSTIQFKTYHSTEEDIYPALTLCFKHYLDHDFFDHNSTLIEAYKQFLSGKETGNEYFANISYDEAIIDIKDFITDIAVTEFNEQDEMNTLKCSKENKQKRDNRDDNEASHNLLSVMMGEVAPIPVDGLDASEKCWRFEIPFLMDQNIMSIAMRMKKSIFPERQLNIRKGFKVIFSYPGQTLRARVMKNNWKSVIQGNFEMVFNIENMVVLKKRNKAHEPCHRDYTRDDVRLRDSFIRSLGCRPTFITSSSAFTQCNAGRKMKNCDGPAWDRNYVEPCRQVEKTVLYLRRI